MPLFIAVIKKNRLTLAILLLSLLLIMFATGNFTRAAEDDDVKNAVSTIEAFYTLFIVMAVSLIIKNTDEMALTVTCDIKMKKLFSVEYITILIFSFLPALAFSFIAIPQWMFLKFIISLTVTVFFFSAFALLVRIIVNNYFANLGFCTVFFMIFYINTISNAGGGKTNIEYYADLFINTYSHTILRTGAESVWYVTDIMWLINRIVFTVLGMICLIAGLLLSEKINVYKNKQIN